MILHLIEKLGKCRIVLASGSPRRKNILESIGLKIDVIPSTFEENLEPSMYPELEDFAIDTALYKAKEVADKLIESGESFELLIAADTIVVAEGIVYGKPGNDENATKMLKKLSGTSHNVFTGVVLIWNGYSPSSSEENNFNFIKKFSETTQVQMGQLSDDVISAYVKSGEPLDKAGAYGIHGIGGSLIEKIAGDFYNVAGFPLYRFCTHVQKYYSPQKET